MMELWKNQAGVGEGASLYRDRVVQHLMRDPLKSQEVGVGAGAGIDRYRVA